MSLIIVIIELRTRTRMQVFSVWREPDTAALFKVYCLFGVISSIGLINWEFDPVLPGDVN